MFGFKKNSPVCLATLFVVLACAALIVLDGWRTWQARDEVLHEASVDTSNMAQALSQHADDTFKEADLVLQVLLEHINEDGLQPQALDRIHRQIMGQVNELPQLHGIFVYDDTGRWLVSSQLVMSNQYNNADREYFNWHRNHPDSQPHVGPPVQSRSTGAWIFTVSRRISKRDGSFGGVVLATISFDYFKQYYSRFNVGERGGILFASQSGTNLIRLTKAGATTGQDLSQIPLVRDHAARNDHGTIEMVSPVDGELRINSYARLQRYPLFVSVAVSKDEILAAWRRDALMRAVAVLFLVGVFATMGRRMVHQIQWQVRSEYEAVSARTRSDQLNVTLARLAMHDALTGLANRRHFDRTLSTELSRLAKQKAAMALVLIDVDHFKLYNDIYGHAKGDECLKAIAEAIGACKRRPRDLAARYGGEEFALVLPECDIRSATALAYSLRQAIADLQLPHSGARGGRVTISIGVAAYDPVGKNDGALALIESADQALYQAKQSGRDRVVSDPQGLKAVAQRDMAAHPQASRHDHRL